MRRNFQALERKTRERKGNCSIHQGQVCQWSKCKHGYFSWELRDLFYQELSSSFLDLVSFRKRQKCVSQTVFAVNNVIYKWLSSLFQQERMTQIT